ncbi:MAG: T9SS type A sorting domain-containing protein [Candidatus Kapabacteria bacterium]|nr:T9SS type A sorting domain-containing protein [Candidatus Kapabacteria bacterium]
MIHFIKIYFFALISPFFFSQSLMSQWNIIQSYDWGTEIREIQSFNSNKCIVLGAIYDNLGIFIDQTKDGGSSWKRIYNDSSYKKNNENYLATPLYSINYIDSNLIIAVGDSGLIIRSSDDGLTWQKIRLDKNKMLYKIKMKDHNNGIILNGLYDRYYPELHKTKDGGITWEKLNIPKELKWTGYFDFQIINDSTIYLNAKPEDEEPCIIHVFNDFEKYEKLYYQKNPKHKYNYESMFFIDDKKGWIVGGPDILKTTDGGVSWTLNSFPGKQIRKIKFLNESLGIAIGNQFTSFITYDSGLTWQENNLKVDNNLVGMTDFDISDSSTIYFCNYQNVYKFLETLYKAENSSKGIPAFKISNIVKLNEKIKIDFDKNVYNIPFTIKIFDIQGRELFKQGYQETSIELSPSKCNILTEGVYFILIQTTKESYTNKILII